MYPDQMRIAKKNKDKKTETINRKKRLQISPKRTSLNSLGSVVFYIHLNNLFQFYKSKLN